MAIGDKDQKLLWARAAGRCSMPECRRVLTLDKVDGGAATLGEMCHIVGEAETATRGRSILEALRRNSYPNLILLCGHHHTIIDADETAYPVELLHQIKVEHELWVDRTLGGRAPDPEEMVYADLIDTVTQVLQLENWICFVDEAVRDFVRCDFLDATDILAHKQIATIWPDKKPELRQAIQEVMAAFCDYMRHFLKNVEERGDSHFGPDHSYRRYINPDYQKYADNEDRWSERNFWLLCNYVVKLNDFASAVRRHSNPLFFLVEGSFLLIDSLGYRFNGTSTRYMPTAEDVRTHLAVLDGLDQKL